MKKITLLICLFGQLWAEDLTWSDPTTLSTLGADASSPCIAMDASGNVVAAWIENTTVYSNTLPLGGSWGEFPATVSNAGATSLQLVIDPQGAATAIWNQNSIIQLASLPAGGSWSTPIALSSTISSAPAIAVDTTGNRVAIWSSNGSIQSATCLVNGTWPTTPDYLTMTASNFPRVEIGNGNVVAVWFSLVNGIDTIYATSKNLNGAWATSKIISTTSSNCVRPEIAVDRNGNATAVWFQYSVIDSTYSDIIVQASFLPINGSWSAPMNLSPPGRWDLKNLVAKVKYNPLGFPLVFWNNSSDGSTLNVQGTVFVPPSWIPIIPILSYNLYAYDLDFTTTLTNGYAFGAYMSYNPLSASTVIQTVYANTFAAVTNVSNGQIISATLSSGYPRISGANIGAENYAAAIWLSFNGSNKIVQAAFGSAPLLLAPTNLSVTQGSNDFGLFTEYYNTLTWQGPLPPRCNGFLIYRNDVLVASGPSTVFQYIDHNRMPDQSDLYGVAFLTPNGDQSPISSILFP